MGGGIYWTDRKYIQKYPGTLKKDAVETQNLALVYENIPLEKIKRTGNRM